MDANEFLNRKGLIHTRELINIHDERVDIIELLNEYKALSQHDVIKSVCDCKVKGAYEEWTVHVCKNCNKEQI